MSFGKCRQFGASRQRNCSYLRDHGDLPILEGIVLVVQVVWFFSIIIPLWVLSPKASASEVFGSFSNYGGWSSIGTACFVGSITATASFAGSDAAVHMAEETEDASKDVPRMIMLTIAVNGIMAFIFIITYVSSSDDSIYAIHELSGVRTETTPFNRRSVTSEWLADDHR